MTQAADKTFDERMAEAKAADLAANWQIHRVKCIGFAVDMGGCATVEKIIERAEKFSAYILNGKAQ